ncbi:hypothetical protein ASG37_05070 [Sphingomonas sp. Leaf407]|nr:hypothetical protein ASE97_10985 [Sphingomonas sp. Leaf42]KQT30461.1 hypothetical protein ASG37_05070 [Sphingomonas sp. Leaf407]
MLRALALDERSSRAFRRLVLDKLPQILRHDPQLGHLDQHPFGRWVDPRYPAAGLGVAAHMQPVVEVLAGVDRVVQHAQASRARPGDRRCTPVAATRGRDAVLVQPARDRLRPPAGRIFAVDAKNDRRLLGIDPAQAAIKLAIGPDRRHHIIAIGEAAGHAATRDGAPLAAADLVGKVFQEQCRHRAFQADVQLADVTLAQRVDADVGEFQPLVDRRDVGLVAGDPIDCLGADDLERSGSGVG